MRNRFLILAAVAMLGAALGPAARPLPACPMCGQANETEDQRPRAYMLSILFMMGVPAAVVAGFGIGFYRLSRKAATLGQSDCDADPLRDQTDSACEEHARGTTDGYSSDQAE